MKLNKKGSFFSRSLGRRPSEDKVSVYLRKPSNETSTAATTTTTTNNTDKEKKDKFLKDMARRSMEVPTDFLDRIEVCYGFWDLKG